MQLWPVEHFLPHFFVQIIHILSAKWIFLQLFNTLLSFLAVVILVPVSLVIEKLRGSRENFKQKIQTKEATGELHEP